LGILSLALALWRRARADLLLLSYAVANYLAITGTSSEVLYYPRYALPIIVVFVVLAGRAVAELGGRLPRWRAPASGLLAALMAIWPALITARADHLLTQTDTRTLAKNWFDANVPPGSRVLIEGGKIAPSRETVPLRESAESLARRIAYWRREDPRQARFLEAAMAGHPGGGYELKLVKVNALNSLEFYIADGVDYFVVRPRSFLESRRAVNSSVVVLNALRSDPRIELLKRFAEQPEVRPGPEIEIYRVRTVYEPGDR
jgi:hypothetical protein